MAEVDGILVHDKPICMLYMGDETVNPLMLEKPHEDSEID
jgi:hypothetical protein